ncbi:MAG: phosphate ABC transporter substrate-binding protein [candidate division KSB1 bacterium]|nr:phosphate ABC transporter substrate-binding protein [candidate division KSB1 bacterium]
MLKKSLARRRFLLSAIVITAIALPQAGCKSGASGRLTIQNAGSDTMVNLAQAWAEAYAEIEPSVSVEVSGGGTGTGVAALINGTVDIANCSRQLHEDEIMRAQQNTGKKPVEYLVGYDALAIYVHKSNPLKEISLEQLAEIYGEGGTLTKWSQLGVTVPGCANDEIIRVSRQSNSGTYEYFREAVLGKARDFKLGSRDMNGSKDVVDLVAHTPCAIGYSGLGYNTPEVKMLKVSRKTGDTPYPPSVETTLDKTYPIARPLFMYSLGEPTGPMRKYLEWIRSDAGQKVLEEIGYVPLPPAERAATPTADEK